MRIAINAQQLAHLSIEEVISFAQEIGVDGIELWPENVPGGEYSSRWLGRNIQEVSAKIQAAGLEVACITNGFFALSKAESFELAVQSVREALEAASVADAKVVNVYTAGMPAAEFVKVMQALVADVAKHRVVITLENEAHDDSAFPETIAEMLDEIGSPWIKTQYDPCNYFHAGYEAVPKPVEVLNSRIGYFHLKGGGKFGVGTNIYKGSPMRDSDEPIGYGVLAGADFNASGSIRAMQALGYDGWVTLEPHVGKDAILDVLRKDAMWLKSQLG
jgi:sugar phosphate isomerase/epimerase